METKKLVLEKRVITRNRINYVLNQLQDVLQETLKPYAGKKVIKSTPYRGWTKQVRQQIDGIIEGYQKQFQVQITWNICSYSVFLEVRTCFMIGDRSYYENSSRYICSIENDVYLTQGFAPCKKSRTDYTTAEVEAAIEKIAQLEREVSDLKSKYREFVE